jgi:hypothetical protein
MVLGGVVIHAWESAKDALRFYADYSRTAPDELAADAVLLTSPEGQRIVAISACYIGSAEEGERILQPLRRFGAPVADQIGPISYTELQATGDAFFPIGRRYYWKTHFLAGISDDAIEATTDHFAFVPSPQSVVIFQQYGGAVSRVDQTATAFTHRDAQYDFIPTSIWADPTAAEQQTNWVRNLWQTMKPFATGGEYVNNLGDEGEDRIAAAYGANHERLVTLKDKYDPQNFFRLNANIRPST